MEIEFKPKPPIEWEPDEDFWAEWDIEHEGIEEWGANAALMTKILEEIEEDSHSDKRFSEWMLKLSGEHAESIN